MTIPAPELYRRILLLLMLNVPMHQANNNLLLTSSAKMNTCPQLEIYADDVKCSYAATVGQLDEEAMFYLRARVLVGRSQHYVNVCLAYEVLEKIRVSELKSIGTCEMRFRGELDKCCHA